MARVTKDIPDQFCSESEIGHANVWRILDLRWNLFMTSLVILSDPRLVPSTSYILDTIHRKIGGCQTPGIRPTTEPL